MTGQEAYEAWRAAVPEFVCNVPGGPWDELSKAVRAGFDAIAAQQSAPGLREAAVELVADWREGSEYHVTDTGDEITEGIAVNGCADSLAAMLDQFPEPQPVAGLRAERDRFWNALFYIAHRAPDYVPHAGPECVQVAKDAIEDTEPPAPDMGDDL